MQFNPYGGNAAQLAADLVNAGPAAGAEDFDEILASYDYVSSEHVDATMARRLVAWAGRLREIFAADATADRVRLANQLLVETAAPPYISMHDGRAPHFHYAEHEAPLVFRIRAYTASGLAHALCDEPHRVGTCARPGCGLVFVDTSRNGRRRFCSTRCANRAHVAEHRRRQLSSSRSSGVHDSHAGL